VVSPFFSPQLSGPPLLVSKVLLPFHLSFFYSLEPIRSPFTLNPLRPELQYSFPFSLFPPHFPPLFSPQTSHSSPLGESLTVPYVVAGPQPRFAHPRCTITIINPPDSKATGLWRTPHHFTARRSQEDLRATPFSLSLNSRPLGSAPACSAFFLHVETGATFFPPILLRFFLFSPVPFSHLFFPVFFSGMLP